MDSRARRCLCRLSCIPPSLPRIQAVAQPAVEKLNAEQRQRERGPGLVQQRNTPVLGEFLYRNRSSGLLGTEMGSHFSPSTGHSTPSLRGATQGATKQSRPCTQSHAQARLLRRSSQRRSGVWPLYLTWLLAPERSRCIKFDDVCARWRSFRFRSRHSCETGRWCGRPGPHDSRPYLK